MSSTTQTNRQLNLPPTEVQLRGETRTKQQRWLTAAVAKTIKGERGRTKVIAPALGVSEELVYQHADELNPRLLKAAWIPTLVRETGERAILDVLAQACGCVVFSVPQATAPDHADLVQHTATVIKEFGDVLAAVSASIADGTITADERASIEEQASEVHAALASLTTLVNLKAVA